MTREICVISLLQKEWRQGGESEPATVVSVRAAVG